MKDKEIQKILQKEAKRQEEYINLIASENIVSPDVEEALASKMGNKYAEGYAGKRYYKGNRFIDELESLVVQRALSLFGLTPKKWSVNVQALSGSPANMAVLHALVPQGEKIMGLELSHGGHLTHGYKVSLTGKLWKQVSYMLDPKTERLDYEAIREIALREKPKLIIAGYSAYSRTVDFKKFRKIADECGALLLVDMSHIAGLVATGFHQSPFAYADVVTTTTHKTLRGPRGALIFSKIDERDLHKKIESTVFPGMFGGPHMNTIAGIGVALLEANKSNFKTYIEKVVSNAKTFSEELTKLGWRIVSGGTDTHLFLVDLSSTVSFGGEDASQRLEDGGIVVNKNTIPFETRSPSDPSGIRIGTPFVTSQGYTPNDMKKIARAMDTILRK
jgi:glycine hydroxymethyltransferase